LSVAKEKEIYTSKNCASCHGAYAKDLSDKDMENIVKYIKNL